MARRSRGERPPRDVSDLDEFGVRKRVGPGVGGAHEVGAFWDMSERDRRVWVERLRRKQAQVDKLKRDRAELRAALRLRTEEAYQEGLLSVAPVLLDIDRRVAEIARRLLDGELGGDEVRLLRALLPELSKQRDRLYGKTRQRQEVSSVSASVDVNRLIEQARGGGVVDVVDVGVVGEGEGEVEDVEVVGEGGVEGECGGV